MRFQRIAFFLTCAALAAAQTKQQRDLKIEKIEPEAAQPAAPKPVAIPRSYAVIVGISNYQKLPANLQLQFSERDAQSIYTILISPEGGNFKAENVHMLTGPNATLAGLRREIDGWLPTVAKDDDRVLIYFAGHGFVDQGKGYLAPYDVDLKNLTATAYPMDELGSVIGSKIKAKSKILLTDSCHSGAISPEDTQNLNRTLGDLNKSLFSLTASRDRERSFESPELEGGHGVFTYYVVKGLEGAADDNHDGIVSADELAEYVHTNVREATSGQQNPTSEKGSFDPNMLLAWVPAGAAPAAPPAPKFGSLVIEANMDEVEVFVDGKSVGVASKAKPISVPGLPPGEHSIKGVKLGYEPDGPRQETVYPGQESTVSIKILIARRRNKAANDSLDKGLEYYQKGYEQNYRKAAELFEKALEIDPTYSQAAFYLGLTYNALFDQDKAQEYYKKAIAIDPDYLEAHANYGGMLLDIGSVDEAIRQFNIVLQREPNHAVALTLQAQAYRLKQLYPQSIDSARKAIKLTPKNAEPHLWLADSLRLSGSYADARSEYNQYLQLSNFDSKMAGQLNYYVLGFLAGFGKRSHAAQQDIWKDLRSLAYFGICDCERNLANFDQAIANCTKSLTYDAKDPYAHYALGLSYMRKAVQAGSVAELDPALRHFQEMLAINPDLSESDYARKNIASIQKAMQAR
ncbi:MAG TPA: tetratricopeptide repeat protein [Bryobacteraceae bacterium]|jgi:tetratricopeptide (TPR) repeat protein|nr:tetratricopeptide repeat protein [Bryobacteraceae bacterium]